MKKCCDLAKKVMKHEKKEITMRKKSTMADKSLLRSAKKVSKNKNSY